MGSLAGLSDYFNQTSLDSRWTQFTGGSATFSYAATGASVVFPGTTSSSTDGDLSPSAGAIYNFTSSTAIMQVTSVSGALATHTDCVLRVRQNSTNYVTIFYEAGTLFFSKVVAGAQTNIASVAYSATTHAWWRLREAGGTTFWDTSPDGISWTNQASQANPITITAVDVLIGGLCFGADSSPSNFTFKNFNLAPSMPFRPVLISNKMVGSMTQRYLFRRPTLTTVPANPADAIVNVNDSITVTESVLKDVPVNASVSDTVTVTEFIDKLVTSFINKSDTVTLTEFTAFTIADNATVSDTITLTELVLKTVVSLVNVSDTVTLTESVAGAVSTASNVSDSITVTENVQLNLVSFINVNDTVTLTENLPLLPQSYVNKSDTITLTESSPVTLAYNANVNDTVTLTENLLRRLDSFVNVNDTVTVTENILRLLISFVNVSDSLTVSEALLLVDQDFLAAMESISVTESVRLQVVGMVAVSDSVAVSESVSVVANLQVDIEYNNAAYWVQGVKVV